MKINIYTPVLSSEYPGLYYDLKELNTKVLPLTTNIGGIAFDIDNESINKLEILSYNTKNIDFIDAYNNSINMQASTLKNYLSAIKEYHSDNLIKVNKLYNTLKNSAPLSLTNEGILSAYNGLSLNKVY